MAPRVDPVATDETLPAQADVVIIGGGIIGTSAALFLAEKGVSTVLCEKGHIAGEQSSRNWGWCRKMARDPREIPLVIESLRLWQGMNERVEAETGFRTCGIMYLAEKQDDLARLGGWLDHARDYQLDTRVIDRRRGRAPAARLRKTLGRRALHAERRQGRAANGRAGNRRGGAPARRHVLTGCAARGIETEAGRVAAVVTEKGRIACQSVVLAGGAWSRLFCGNLGIDLPQLKVLGSVMRTERLDGGPEISASGGLFGYRKRMDGGYTVATLGVRTIDIVPDSLPAPAGIPAERSACTGRSCACESAGVLPRNGGCSGAGAWISPRRSKRSGCSIRPPTRPCSIAPAPASPRLSRPSATSRSRKAGAA